jgi:hypothetical protein
MKGFPGIVSLIIHTLMGNILRLHSIDKNTSMLTFLRII